MAQFKVSREWVWKTTVDDVYGYVFRICSRWVCRCEFDKWVFNENEPVIPIIIPRNYLNFIISDLLKAVATTFGRGDGNGKRISVLAGDGRREVFKGNIVGFSNRRNTILVPETFMRGRMRACSEPERTFTSYL